MPTRQRVWLTATQREEVFLRYASGENSYAIAESLGVCANNVLNAVRRLGGDVRDKRTARVVLPHREEAFDVLTPESEYWSGLYFADGWIQIRKGASPLVCIALAVCDEAHLFRLRDDFLGSGHKITRKLTKNAKFGVRLVTPRWISWLSIPSPGLSRALFALGMHKKSLARVAPDCLIDSRHFWRGLVDGDGYVSVTRDGKPRLGLCGGEVLMQQFIDYLTRSGITNRLHVGVQHEKTGGTIYRADMTCSTAARAIRLLYMRAQVSLERKQMLATSILSGSI